MRVLLVLVIAALGCGSDDAMGQQGLQGLRGPAGPAGQRGSDGAVGPSGPEGPAGARGPTGPQGPAGKDALTYRPSAYAACELLLDLIGPNNAIGGDGTTETLLEYTFTRYVNGDLDASCKAGLGSAESASGSLFYPSVTPGATSGNCTASVDYPPYTQTPGNVGAWQFEIVGAAIRATYADDDAGHPLNGRSWSFGENDCRSFQMAATNQWKDAALSDVL